MDISAKFLENQENINPR